MSAYVHAALLLHEAKQKIDEENVKKVLKAAGVDVDETRVKALVAALSEVNIDEAIKTAPSLVAPTAPPAPPTPTQEKKEEKKKPPEEEKKTEEAAIQGLGALFG
jgi:large subunit ribosomal protein L12